MIFSREQETDVHCVNSEAQLTGPHVHRPLQKFVWEYNFSHEKFKEIPPRLFSPNIAENYLITA
jgi:hypothetical protein